MEVKLLEVKHISRLGKYHFPTIVEAKYELEDGIYCWQVDADRVNVVQCWEEPKNFKEAEKDLERELSLKLPLFHKGNRGQWSERGWKVAEYARKIRNKNREKKK